MSILKKLFAGITVLTVITMLCPPATKAITVDELNAQIAALTAQIAALQGTTTTTSTGTITGIPAGFTFTKFLTMGSISPDVVYLKKALDVLVPTHAAWTGSTLYGAKVKAAVIAFQEANMATILTPIGLTHGTGNLGAATRTRLNAILANGTTGGTTGGTVVPTGAGLTVTLASDTPAAGTLIRSNVSALVKQANANFTKFVFTNGDNAEVKVTTLKLKRGGISTDSDLSNVYLYDGTTKLAEYNSFSSQIITFSNVAGLFTVPAGGSKIITVKGDLSGSTTATVASINLGVNAATDIVSNASAVKGTFPLTGNNMGVALVSDLGYVNVADANGNYQAYIDPGTTHSNLFWFNITANTQDVQIEKLVLTAVGTISATDLQNIKLEVGGVAITDAVQLASDKTVTFDFSANPYKITKGQTKTVYVTGDVPSGTNRTFKFTIRKVDDLITKDVQYGVYTTPEYKGVAFTIVDPNAAGNGTTINPGTLTVTVASDTPSGNVANSATNVSLAKWNVKANGEAVKITGMDIKVTNSNSEDLDNGKLYYNGSQIGNTDPIITHSDTVPYTFTTIIGAGETGVFEFKADMTKSGGSALTTGTVKAEIVTSAVEATGQSSLAAVTINGTAGRTLTIASGTMSVAKNSSLADYSLVHPTAVKGATNVKVGSFVITAGAGEGVSINQIVIGDLSGGDAFGAAFQSLKLMNGTTQIGTTLGTLSSSAGADYTFSISPAITLNAGQQYVVDVYADSINGGTSYFATAMVGVEVVSVSATGLLTSSSASITPNQSLQTIVLATSGTITITAVSSPVTPVAGQLVSGSSDNIFAVLSFATGPAEGAQINRIKLTDTTNFGGDLNNLKLISVGTGSATGVQIGSTVASLDSSKQAEFNLSTPWIIPADTTYYLVVKAGISAYPNFVSGSTHVLYIVDNTYVDTFGASSGNPITGSYEVVSSAATSQTQTAYRTKVAVSKNASSPSGVTVAGAGAEVLRFDTAVNSNNSGALSAVALTMSGSAVMSGSGNASIYDASDPTTALQTETYVAPTCSAGTTALTLSSSAGIPVGANVMISIDNGAAVTRKVTAATDSTHITVAAVSACDGTNDTVYYRPLQPGTGNLYFGAQTTLGTSLANGATSVTVSSINGFAVGDLVTFVGYNAANEFLTGTATITGLSGTTMTFSGAATVTGASAGINTIVFNELSGGTYANALLAKHNSAAVVYEGASYSAKPYGSINKQLAAGTTVTFIVKGDTTGATTNNTLRADIYAVGDFVWSDSLSWTINSGTVTFPVTGGTLTYN